MKKINIREALLQMDKNTDCKYDLTSLYEACNLDDKNKQKLVQYINAYESPENIGKFLQTNGFPGMSEAVEDDIADDELKEWIFDDEEESDKRYEYIKSKSVMDSDGFFTDYTMYRDTINDKFVFVFGDKDCYEPEEGYFDWECETEAEANEWFDSYNGFEDGDDFITESKSNCTLGSNVKDWYAEKYQDDDSSEINNITFKDVANAINSNKDVYEVIGVGDSVIRERVFQELANILNTSYDTVYDAYMYDEQSLPLNEIAPVAMAAIGAAASGFGSAIGDKVGSKLLGEDANVSTINASEIEDEIKSVAREFCINQLGYDDDFVSDYIIVEVTEDEDRVKVQVRTELSYEESSELADALNKIVSVYDKDAYFDHYTSNVIDAYIRKDQSDDVVDEEIVNRYAPIINSCTDRDSLINVYTDIRNKNERGSMTYGTANVLFDLVIDKIDELDENNNSVREAFELGGYGDNVKYKNFIGDREVPYSSYEDAKSNLSNDYNIESYREELQNFLNANDFNYFVDATFDGRLCIEINWGDWKHEHGYCDHLVTKFFQSKGLMVDIEVDQTEDNGTDAYSATHYYDIDDIIFSQRPIKEALIEQKLGYNRLEEGIWDDIKHVGKAIGKEIKNSKTYDKVANSAVGRAVGGTLNTIKDTTATVVDKAKSTNAYKNIAQAVKETDIYKNAKSFKNTNDAAAQIRRAKSPEEVEAAYASYQKAVEDGKITNPNDMAAIEATLTRAMHRQGMDKNSRPGSKPAGDVKAYAELIKGMKKNEFDSLETMLDKDISTGAIKSDADIGKLYKALMAKKKQLGIKESVEEIMFALREAYIDGTLRPILNEDYSSKETIKVFGAKKDSLDEGVNEDWTQFEFTSGANPYIAKDETEVKRMLNKYKGKITKKKDGFYMIDDKEKDMFMPNDSLNESFDEDERVQALADYLGIDANEITPCSWSEYEFETPEGDYLVVDEYEAETLAREDIENLYDELGLESFTPDFRDWIIMNALDTEWFADSLRESYGFYTEDIEYEASSMGYDNRLIEEMHDHQVLSDDDFEVGEDGEPDFRELKDEVDIDSLKEEFIDLLVENAGDPIEYYADNFGWNEVAEMAKIHGLINMNEVVDECISVDGIAHFIARYDGDEHDLGNGLYAYRTN